MPLRAAPFLLPVVLALGCGADHRGGPGIAGGRLPGPDVGPLDAADAEARDATPESGPADDSGPADAGPGDARRPCRINSDCADREVCLAGVCGPECRADRDCEGGLACHDGLCQGPGAPCARREDCLPDEVCSLGLCREEPECVFAEDCPWGMDCSNGACAPLGPAEGEGEGPAEGEGEGPAEGEGEGECGGYGLACARKDDCCNELCLDVPPAQDGRGVCTERCLDDGDCPGLDICYPVGAHDVCVPNDVGESCRDPVECGFGLCVNDPATRSAICSVACASRGRCGQTRACGRVNDQAGQALWACVPVGARCTRSLDCTTARCLPDFAGAQTGYCTNDCRNDTDCTLGSVCCVIPDAGGVAANVCVRGACP